MTARIILTAMAHIGYIQSNGLNQFIYDAYLYAEETLEPETYFQLMDDILEQKDIHNDVLTDYVIDVMLNKAKPRKVKLIGG